LIKTLVVFFLDEVQRYWDWLIQPLKPNLQETKSKDVKEKKHEKGKQNPQATEVLMK
jgi:hypothetical protein